MAWSTCGNGFRGTTSVPPSTTARAGAHLGQTSVGQDAQVRRHRRPRPQRGGAASVADAGAVVAAAAAAARWTGTTTRTRALAGGERLRVALLAAAVERVEEPECDVEVLEGVPRGATVTPLSCFEYDAHSALRDARHVFILATWFRAAGRAPLVTWDEGERRRRRR